MPLDENGLPVFGFNLDSSLSPEVRTQLADAIGQQDEAIVRVQAAIREAEAARADLLSWAALLTKVVDLVMPAVASLLASHAKTATTPAYDWQGALVGGLSTLAVTPAANRPAA